MKNEKRDGGKMVNRKMRITKKKLANKHANSCLFESVYNHLASFVAMFISC